MWPNEGFSYQVFVQGAFGLPPLSPRVAIVDTRMTTYMGFEQARLFTECLARNNVAVVSELARGIDTAAHEAAIRSDSRTAAMLGTPLDVSYPPENA